MRRAHLTRLLVLATLAACRDDPVIGETNAAPVAEARVVSESGESVDETSDGGLTFGLAGTPLTITLDGSGSRDADGPNGRPVRYRWLSGTLAAALAPDAGTDAGPPTPPLRWVPPDAGQDWPPDEERPSVELGEGVWSFTLWVEDNHGSVSEPDTITIVVGAAVNPAIAQCIETVLPSVQEECKECLCAISDSCRTAADQSVCNADCWGLIGCIRMQCPNFTMTMDTACVTTNCGAFLAGSTGSRMLAPCVVQCESACGG